MKTIQARLMVLAWLALPASVSAFYNPSSGRWLSRDPIEEEGGLSLYGFVDNSPVDRLDPYGQDPWGGHKLFFWLFGRCICNQSLFNPRTHCCIAGQVLPRKPIDSGVVQYKWEANPGRAGKYHVWLQWDGVALDSNGDDWYRPSGGSKTVTFPQQVFPGPGVPTPIKLSPCEYDFEKLKSCLVAKGTAEHGTRGGLCDSYAKEAISECAAKSMR